MAFGKIEKTYSEMRKVDISKYVKKRGGEYLPWGRCKELLHELGAEMVYYEPLLTEKGHSLFMTDTQFGEGERTHHCYEVRVKIVIDDLEFEQHYPLINGTNPVMDNSLSQIRISTAQARAFVKGVAIRTGLGFGLWLDDDDLPTDEPSNHKIWIIEKRIQEKVTTKLQKYGSEDEMINAINDTIKGGKLTRQQLAKIMKSFAMVRNLETALDKI